MPSNTKTARRGLGRQVVRAICLVIVGTTLAGCIVAPYPGYYRPYPRYFYR